MLEQRIKNVHIDSIVNGDVIVCRDGKTRTVTPEYIKHDKLIGRSLFGDSYNSGTIKVKRVWVPLWDKEQLINA